MKISGSRLNIYAGGWDFVDDKIQKNNKWGRCKPKTNRMHRKTTCRFIKNETKNIINSI